MWLDIFCKSSWICLVFTTSSSNIDPIFCFASKHQKQKQLQQIQVVAIFFWSNKQFLSSNKRQFCLEKLLLSAWLLTFFHYSFQFLISTKISPFTHVFVGSKFWTTFYKSIPKFLVAYPKKTRILFFITFFNLINCYLCIYKFRHFYKSEPTYLSNYSRSVTESLLKIVFYICCYYFTIFLEIQKSKTRSVL